MQKSELSGALDWIGVRKSAVALVCLGALAIVIAGGVLVMPGTAWAVEAPAVGPAALEVDAVAPTPRIYLPMIEKDFSEHVIAFFSDRQATKDKYTDIFLMNSGGYNQHSIVNPGTGYQPAAEESKFEWRPVYGDVIVYPRLFEGSNSYTDLFVARADLYGTVAMTNITSSGDSSEYGPTWSKGPGAGDAIAFVSNKDSGWEIYKINYTGLAIPTSQWQRLTNNSANEWGPQWSPDGSKIAYLSYKDTGSLQVWIMNPSGGSQTRLTNDFWSSGTFSWNDDGTKIAYDYSDNGEYRVDVVPAVLNNPTPTSTHLTGTDCWGPAWSPDGNTIAYHKWIGFVEIYARDSNGSNERRLTNDYHETRAPSWSPDSEYITYMQNHWQDGKYWEVYVMPADGSSHTRLTDNPAKDKFPAFSPVEN